MCVTTAPEQLARHKTAPVYGILLSARRTPAGKEHYLRHPDGKRVLFRGAATAARVLEEAARTYPACELRPSRSPLLLDAAGPLGDDYGSGMDALAGQQALDGGGVATYLKVVKDGGTGAVTHYKVGVLTKAALADYAARYAGKTDTAVTTDPAEADVRAAHDAHRAYLGALPDDDEDDEDDDEE